MDASTTRKLVGALIAALIIATTGGISIVPKVDAQAPPRSTPKSLGTITNVAQTVNGSAAVLDSIHCLNTNAAVTYLQVYNVAIGTAVTVGTTAPTQSFGMQSNATGPMLEVDTPYNAYYSNGIKVAATTGRTNGVAPGAGIDCNFTVR